MFIDLATTVLDRFRPEILLTYGGHPVSRTLMLKARATGTAEPGGADGIPLAGVARPRADRGDGEWHSVLASDRGALPENLWRRRVRPHDP